MLSTLAALTLCLSAGAPAEIDYLGRWDVLLDTGTTFNSCWWKVEKAQDGKLQGSAVIRWGSAGPAKKVEIADGELRIVLEDGGKEVVYRSRLEGEKLIGSVKNPDGKVFPFEGRRAPDLSKARIRKWGKPASLFDGKSLAGWTRRGGKDKPGWEVKDGILSCIPQGDNDLVSEKKFQDFKLHLEYMVEKDSNSGVYLRGRYEVQILDDHGKGVESHGNGSVYSRIAQKKNVSKPAGEWQVFEITLVGRMVTIILNDEPIIENGYLDGITGGAYPDPWEGTPGPLMLQGDHGKVSFRNIQITVPEAQQEKGE